MLFLSADLSLYQTQAVPLFCDSKSALHIAENSIFHDRTKHINIDYHIVRDRFLVGVIKPLAIFSLKQLANFFTKPLGTTRFMSLVAQLGVINTYTVPSCGGVLKTKACSVYRIHEVEKECYLNLKKIKKKEESEEKQE